MSTAAVVIIGDEILSGKFADENGPFLIQQLATLGVDLVRIAVVGDAMRAIVSEVRLACSCADVVITTGGVGPTHDDITLEAVAEALERPLFLHPELEAMLDRYQVPKDASNLRMATVPQGTELVRSHPDGYPVLRVGKVWVLPGIPALVRRKFSVMAPLLQGVPKLRCRVYATDDESGVAAALAAVAAAHPAVAVGSYPRSDDDDHRLIVTVDGRDPAATHAAVQAVQAVVQVVRVELAEGIDG